MAIGNSESRIEKRQVEKCKVQPLQEQEEHHGIFLYAQPILLPFHKGGKSLTFGPTKKVCCTVLQDLDIAYDPKTKFQALQYRQREKKKHIE